ncbi:unnamed protein product [Symbiodinium natans]|uniref:C3H1-type domain-containing protein n=1 Tax=Symbiodinium natans TaxID=878477 RepID=A0A812I438_9DINO|nr:unnamed protein product [Symbiodinium natans]
MDPASFQLDTSSETGEAPMGEHGGDSVDELFAQALDGLTFGANVTDAAGGGNGTGVATSATLEDNGSGTVSGPTISSSQVDGNGDTLTTVAPGTTAGAVISTGLGDGPSTVPDTAVAQSVSGPGPSASGSVLPAPEGIMAATSTSTEVFQQSTGPSTVPGTAVAQSVSGPGPSAHIGFTNVPFPGGHFDSGTGEQHLTGQMTHWTPNNAAVQGNNPGLAFNTYEQIRALGQPLHRPEPAPAQTDWMGPMRQMLGDLLQPLTSRLDVLEQVSSTGTRTPVVATEGPERYTIATPPGLGQPASVANVSLDEKDRELVALRVQVQQLQMQLQQVLAREAARAGETAPLAEATPPPPPPLPSSHHTPGGTRVPSGPSMAIPKVPGVTAGEDTSWQAMGPAVWEVVPPPPPLPPEMRARPRALKSEDSAALMPSEETARSIQDLPKLEISKGNTEDAGMILGDWLTVVKPMMAGISATAAEWWDQVTGTAYNYYDDWLAASPLKRLELRDKVMGLTALFEHSRWSRTEQRGAVLMLAALPADVKEEMVTIRAVQTIPMLFRLLTKYQPGGAGEKQALLRTLTAPAAVNTATDGIAGIRKWSRALTRAQELKLALPDPTLLVKALDQITAAVITGQSLFRLSTFRLENKIDYAPTLSSTKSLAQMLLAELEMVTGSELGGRRPKVAAMETEAKGKGKGKDKGQREHGQCWNWMTPKGCRKGNACSFPHDKARMVGRCYNCSAEDHQKANCPYPTTSADTVAAKETNDKATEAKGRGKHKGKPKPIVKKVEPDEPASSTTSSSSSTAQAAFLQEASELIKTMRLAALRGETDGWGLLDGGATACLRKAKSNREFQRAAPITVALATGSTQLRINDAGTLLTNDPSTSPIVAMHELIQLGTGVTWDQGGICIKVPKFGQLPVRLATGCPEVPEALALKLIEDIEQKKRDKMAFVKELRVQKEDGGGLEQEGTMVFEDPIAMKRWLQDQFLHLPEGVIDALTVPAYAKGNDCLPWSRRTRKAMMASKFIVLNLFAGKTRGFFQHYLDGKGMDGCYVIDVDLPENLLCDQMYGFLLELARSGHVKMVMGGPPDKTFEAPKQWRGNDPQDRLGRSELGPRDLRAVEKENVLILRQLVLYMVAEEARRLHHNSQAVGLVLEHKAPNNGENTEASKPEIWNWPEVQHCQVKYKLEKLEVDFGDLGHRTTKQQGLLVSHKLYFDEVSMVNCKDCGSGEEGMDPQEMTKGHEWPDGLKWAVLQLLLRLVPGGLSIHRLDTKFRQHVAQGHIPFRRDCLHCLAGGAKDGQHRRLPISEAYTISADLSGPYTVGLDEYGRVKYMCTMVYTIPVFADLEPEPMVEIPEGGGQAEKTRSSEAVNEAAPLLDDEELVGVDTTSLLGEDTPDYEPDLDDERCSQLDEPLPPQAKDEEAVVLRDYGLDCEEDWNDEVDPGEWECNEEVLEEELPKENLTDFQKRLVQEQAEAWKQYLVKAREQADSVAPQDLKLHKLQMVELTFAESLRDKTPASVVGAIGRVYSKLKMWGMHVARFHTDKGGEFLNAPVCRWLQDRGIYQTCGQGGSYKQNGRAEAAVGICKRATRTLLHGETSAKRLWPGAWRWVAERRLRRALARLGMPVKPLVPFGTVVWIRKRHWHKAEQWDDRVHKGVVIAPAQHVSRGYVVKVGNDFFTTTTLFQNVQMADTGAISAMDEVEVDAVPPRQRARGKQGLASLSVAPAALSCPGHDREQTGHNLVQAWQKADSWISGPLQETIEWLQDSLSGTKLRSDRQTSEGLYITNGVYRRGGVIGITNTTTQQPDRLRTQVLNAILAAAFPTDTWTSSTLSVNNWLGPHRDIFNQRGTNNLLVCLSPSISIWTEVEPPFTGLGSEELVWKEVRPGLWKPGQIHRLRCGDSMRLDPRKWHASEDGEEKGPRVLAVAFSLAVHARPRVAKLRLRQREEGEADGPARQVEHTQIQYTVLDAATADRLFQERWTHEQANAHDLDQHPLQRFVDDWEGEWSPVLPPDGILPTTETVDQAASAAYEYRSRWAGLLPDPEIDPNQVLRDPSIRLDRVNPPEEGMQIDPVIQRHLVDENDPESRRRALTDDRPDLTMATIINYRYMYDDENQLEIHQFAMMVNHTVGYEEVPHWQPLDIVIRSEVLYELQEPQQAEENEEEPPEDDEDVDQGDDEDDDPPGDGPDGPGGGGRGRSRTPEIRYEDYRNVRPRYQLRLEHSDALKMLDAAESFLVPEEAGMLYQSKNSLGTGGAATGVVGHVVASEIPIGFEADEQSDLLDGMQLGLKRLGLHEQQKLQQDLWDQSSLDEEPDTWTLKDQVTQVRAIHEQADQVEDDLRLLKSMSVETNVGGTGAPTDVFPEVFLQTKTIQQAQVLQELPAWTPAMSAEYNTIRHEKAAIEPITEQQIRVMEEDDSLIVKRIPAKMVFTRKAASGQRKARACACGNFLQAEESSKTKQELREEVYAAGIDITVLRTMLAVGARRGWKAGTTDIKGAFLNAPLLQRTKTKTERIILDPPKILSRAGIIPPYEKWLVTRALYGLDISPKSWAVFRNQQLNGRRFQSGGAWYTWQACRTDQNLWRILSEDGRLCGLVSIYVDDILGVMEDGVLQSCFSDLSQLWACSTPEYVAQGSVRFCGFDISEGSDDRRGFLLRQEAYIDETLGTIRERASRQPTNFQGSCIEV